MALKGSKTERNLMRVFAVEAQAYCRYLYFADKARAEGKSEIAKTFRSIAEGELEHAYGHLEFMAFACDPLTGLPIGSSYKNLKAAIHSEIQESNELYPEMAEIAREEGFDKIADWFETLSKAERSHARRFQRLLDTLES